MSSLLPGEGEAEGEAEAEAEDGGEGWMASGATEHEDRRRRGEGLQQLVQGQARLGGKHQG